MFAKWCGLILLLLSVYVCAGDRVGNQLCPQRHEPCSCGNEAIDTLTRCTELSIISCSLDENCNNESNICLNCPEKRTNICEECCCKRSVLNSDLGHLVNRRQTNDKRYVCFFNVLTSTGDLRNKVRTLENIRYACAKPVDPENGKAIYEAEIFTVGEAVKYRCTEGFTLIGSGTRHCNGNGKWAGELPTCEKLCSFPVINSQDGLTWVENPGRKESLRDTNGNVVLSEIEFSCAPGFTLTGPVRVRCLAGGRWDRDPPTCGKSGQTLSQCPRPEVPENGGHDLAQSAYAVGSIVRFHCNAGFSLSGVSVDVCSDSGTWSSQPPKCIFSESPVKPTTIRPTTVKDGAPHCQKPSEIKYGTVSLKIRGGASVRSTNLLEVGTSVEYQCNHPYKLDGQPEQFCLATGQWSGSTPKCSPACGKGVEPKSPQVINGTVAKENGYPWQVALTTYESRAEIRFIHCGGVVISEKWVLTAAHCITTTRSRDLLSSDTFLLFFGKHYADRNIDNNDVISRKVFQLVLHPKYDPWTFDSDLGLMLLDRDVVFGATIVPLCLPDLNSMVTFQDGLKGVVTGWGNTDKDGTAAVVLMMLELPIVNSKKCEESYKRHNFKTTVTDNMFCAGADEGGKNTCQGDSGGAMAFYKDDHYVLEGIVSWGNKDDCAAAGFYGGFVRVRNFIPWILLYV